MQDINQLVERLNAQAAELRQAQSENKRLRDRLEAENARLRQLLTDLVQRVADLVDDDGHFDCADWKLVRDVASLVSFEHPDNPFREFRERAEEE